MSAEDVVRRSCVVRRVVLSCGVRSRDLGAARRGDLGSEEVGVGELVSSRSQLVNSLSTDPISRIRTQLRRSLLFRDLRNP